jgi:hypothetical protein
MEATLTTTTSPYQPSSKGYRPKDCLSRPNRTPWDWSRLLEWSKTQLTQQHWLSSQPHPTQPHSNSVIIPERSPSLRKRWHHISLPVLLSTRSTTASQKPSLLLSLSLTSFYRNRNIPKYHWQGHSLPLSPPRKMSLYLREMLLAFLRASWVLQRMPFLWLKKEWGWVMESEDGIPTGLTLPSSRVLSWRNVRDSFKESSSDSSSLPSTLV